MASLESIVGAATNDTDVHDIARRGYSRSRVPAYIMGKYSTFTEQYLEPMVGADSPQMASPTACTIKSIPVIDDW